MASMSRFSRPLLMMVIAVLAAAAPARAQAPDPIADQRKTLEQTRENIRQAEERRQAIAAEIEALKGERAKLQQALIDSAAAIRDKQAAAEARETRIGELAESERQLKVSLASRRDVLANVIAALERMGRTPPPALLVRPDDALEAIRSAILLGAVVPDMRAEAEALGSDLREMARVKDLLAAERDSLAREAESLGAERQRLAALIDERQREVGEREEASGAEAAKAAQLSREAGDLEALIARMEKAQAAKAAEEAGKADDASRAGGAGQGEVNLASLHDAARLSPALPFERARGMLPLPVSGRRLKVFGKPNGFGGAGQGSTFATSFGAPVTAPCDGWVVYAGPFRSYGQLLILNAGGGYHVLLAGMERITVGLNQFVLAGEPVAVMRDDAATAGKTAASPAVKPVLYVEFRKDRGSIDPSPWWAGSPGEKVGG